MAQTRDKNGDAALYRAARAKLDSREVARLLLASGAKVDVRDARDRTPLQVALRTANARMMELLLDAGADILAIDFQGQNVIDHAILACQSGHGSFNGTHRPARDRLDMLEAILCKLPGKDTAILTSLPAYQIHDLLISGRDPSISLPALEILLAHGLPVDAICPKTRATPLWTYAGNPPRPPGRGGQQNASSSQESDAISILLVASADGNFRHVKTGRTPLMRAAKAGSADIVALLLVRGADLAARDKAQKPVLAYAVASSAEAKLIRVLLEGTTGSGSGPIVLPLKPGLEVVPKQLHYVDRDDGQTLLHKLAREKQAAAELLLRYMPDELVDAGDARGRSALSFAVENKYLTTTFGRALLSRGADINRRDTDGWTPLMRAAGTGNVKGAEFTLQHGANVDVVGNQCGQSESPGVEGGVERTGATALSLAVRGGFVEAARILLTVGWASWEVTLCHDPEVI